MSTTSTAPTARLILASGSPRRREILDRFGLSYRVRPVDLDESVLASETPGVYVQRLARAKALARIASDEVVLAADTTVTLENRILGKPASRDQAVEMLRFLSARTHSVLTGVAVADGSRGDVHSRVQRTEVRFVELDERLIDWYTSTGEGDDKAGSYAIQGQASLFIEHLQGSWDNVVGLPISAVEELLRASGRSLLDWC